MEPVMINSRFETFSKHVISALFKILLDALVMISKMLHLGHCIP